MRIEAAEVHNLSGLELVLRQDSSVGREPECDVTLPAPSISRRHARIEIRENGAVEVFDLGSANGVFMGGRRVERGLVQPGTTFTLGGITLRLLPSPKTQPSPTLVPPAQTFAVSTTGMHRVMELVQELRPLEDLGESVVMAAAVPIELGDPEEMWLVVSGKIYVYARSEDGARSPVLEVGQGQGFFGIDAHGYDFDFDFIADGRPGTKLARFELDELRLLTLVSAHRHRLSKLVDAWVQGLASGLRQDAPTESGHRAQLVAGESTEVSPGTVLQAKETVWITMPSAELLFNHLISLSKEVEGLPFPLVPGSRIEVLGEQSLTLEPGSTYDTLPSGNFSAGLHAFHRVVGEYAKIAGKFEEAEGFQRRNLQVQQEERAQRAAQAAIGSVLGGAEVWKNLALLESDAAPILRAAELVGRHLGLEVKAHPNPRPKRDFEEALIDIACVSGFRVRRIRLGDEWWLHDQGPFLTWYEESESPVAMLPTGPGAYECIDPVAGSRESVDAETALSMSGFGYAFYAPLPNEKVERKEFFRFAFGDIKSEVPTILLSGLLLGLMSVATPWLTGKIFDDAIPQAEHGLLNQFAIGLFLIAFMTAAFQVTQKVAVLRIQGKVDYRAQAAIWDRLLNLPTTFFREFTAGDLADRASGVTQMRQLVAGAGVASILGFAASLLNVAQMAYYSRTLALVAVLLTLLYFLLNTVLIILQVRLQRKELLELGKLRGLVLQLITGVAKLRVTGAEPYAVSEWSQRFARQRKFSFKVGRMSNLVVVLNAGFPIFSSITLFCTMYYLKESADSDFNLSTGEFLAFNAAFGIFLAAIQALSDACVSLLKIIPLFERMKPILEALPEVDDQKAAPGRLRGAIALHNVRFRYADGPWVIDDLSLEIEPGEFVAIVGGSGSGKSTLLRLLLGFEAPETGRVTYDGQDLASLDLRQVRQQLGVVLQDSRVLPADIYRNIVGSSSRTVEEAWAAAHKAGLDRDIRSMPMQMHTYLSEGGGGLSGGQRQRLLIARALVNAPKILLLDEATSALDNRAQAIVTESMNQLAATRIVIAHRLSTIRDADRICYLEHGVIREQGSFDELMAKDGAFARLARRQLS